MVVFISRAVLYFEQIKQLEATPPRFGIIFMEWWISMLYRSMVYRPTLIAVARIMGAAVTCVFPALAVCHVPAPLDFCYSLIRKHATLVRGKLIFSYAKICNLRLITVTDINNIDYNKYVQEKLLQNKLCLQAGRLCLWHDDREYNFVRKYSSLLSLWLHICEYTFLMPLTWWGSHTNFLLYCICFPFFF